MSSGPGPVEIARDAHWLVQALDPTAGVVRLVAMDRDRYRQASFLDDRMMQGPVSARIVPWLQVEQALGGDLRRDARWIFHIGHVGSTLLARLLGELPGVLSIREPRFLRDLATMNADSRQAYARLCPAIFSRTFAPAEQALVKATSFVSEIAAEIVPSGERALFMFAGPEAYVASILAGENSVRELQALASSREGRMRARVPDLNDLVSAADFAAAAWACEMTSLEQAAAAMSDRSIRWLDFDRALNGMPEALAEAASLFGFNAADSQVEAIARGPLMRRYSKALEYEYSPRLRQDLIDEAVRNNRATITTALAKLQSAAESSPLLARALERAQSEG